jgi:hypothetical protein
MSYDEWGIAGGVLERLVNPTGEIFDRDRGCGPQPAWVRVFQEESDRTICQRR